MRGCAKGTDVNGGHSHGPPFEISLHLRTIMPFCSECGEQVEATWKFCPHCNTKQQTAAVVIGNDSVNTGDITVNQMIDEDSLKKSFKEVVSEIHPVCSKCGIKKSELLVCCNQNCNVYFCKGCGYRNVDNEM